MADLTAEGNRIGKFVRPVAPDGREEKKENRGDGEESKDRSLARLVKINPGKPRNVLISGAPSASALDPHADWNEKKPKNQECRQNDIREDANIGLCLFRNELYEKEEEDRSKIHKGDGRTDKAYWVVEGFWEATLHTLDDQRDTQLVYQ